MSKTKTKTRSFRKPESYEAERQTRAMIDGFLRARGFTIESDERDRGGQTIIAVAPNGANIAMRVRLCWRREEGGRSMDWHKKFSAAQLLSTIKNGDWEQSIRDKVARDRSHGITHLLLVQREDQSIKYAALIPISEVFSIWIVQHDISARLVKEGNLGRGRANHAMNGSSPTLWLQDDRDEHSHEVAEALWNHKGVQDLAQLEPATSVSLPDEEGDRGGADDDTSYIPQEGDRRQVVERQIRERRGQQSFRDGLRERYGDRCLVTGCEVLAVLEAAHIKPYQGNSDNHPENGLLLRADIHTLFDLDLIGIEPERLQLELNPHLAKEYGNLSGKMIDCPRQRRPSREALKLRYEKFQQRLLRAI